MKREKTKSEGVTANSILRQFLLRTEQPNLDPENAAKLNMQTKMTSQWTPLAKVKTRANKNSMKLSPSFYKIPSQQTSRMIQESLSKCSNQ